MKAFFAVLLGFIVANVAYAQNAGIWRVQQADLNDLAPTAQAVNLTIIKTTIDATGERDIVQFSNRATPDQPFYSEVFSVTSKQIDSEGNLGLELKEEASVWHTPSKLFLTYAHSTKLTTITGSVFAENRDWNLKEMKFRELDESNPQISSPLGLPAFADNPQAFAMDGHQKCFKLLEKFSQNELTCLKLHSFNELARFVENQKKMVDDLIPTRHGNVNEEGVDQLYSHADLVQLSATYQEVLSTLRNYISQHQ